MTHKNLLAAIGKNIKEARNEIGMIGYTLGKTLNVNKSYISQLENGSVDVRISQLYLIAHTLEKDVCDLLPLNVIKSTNELKDIPANQESILIHRKVIDQLLYELQEIKNKLK